MPIPDSVALEDLREALQPLYELLGTSDLNVYSEPGLIIAADTITFAVPASIETGDDGKRSPGVRALTTVPDYPHPQESQREFAELAYVVTVKVERP